MASDPLEQAAVLATDTLAALVRFPGTLETFWPAYLQALVQASGARRALLLSSSVGQPWLARAQWPLQGSSAPDDARRSLRLLGQSAEVIHLDGQGEARDLVIRLPLGGEGTVLAVLLLQLPVALEEPGLRTWAAVAAAVPGQFMTRTAPSEQAPKQGPDQVPHVTPAAAHGTADPAAPESLEKAERLHDILRLTQLLSRQVRFGQAAMVLCNQLCARLGAERVSLGWRQGHGIRLAAISHVEHFDAKSNSTRALEEVMEEAVEQVSVLTFPAPPDSSALLRAHQAYAQLLAPTSGQVVLCTVPMDGADGVDGVLCLERREPGFDATELWELQQVGQITSPWLEHLRAQDRWFGLRAWHALQRQAGQWLGPRHTAWKLAGLASVLFVLLGALLPWNYRIDATLAVRSRDLLFMPAPFDGYLRQVNVDVGDHVASGAVLVELDTRDLQLEASMAEADLVRYTREAEKAMAARQLAEMQIELARQQQAQAKLELLRFQLANARLKAPYEGVVIEGELKKNLGAPVRKGDLLLKLARTSRTYLELEIDQAYVHEVTTGTRGEFALVGRPGERYPIMLTHLDPAAVSKDGRTVYLARAALVGQQQPDWRPGMGGNAKLEAGQRPLIWVLTHRTVRFLREFFWL